MDNSNYTLKLKLISMYPIIFSIIIVLLGIKMNQNTMQEKSSFWIIYIVIGFVLMFRYLNMPKEIIVDNELVTFKNWFGREKSAYIKDLKKIQKRMSYITISTEEKRIVIPAGFADFKRFTEDMKKRNPGVEVTGVK